MTPKKFSRREMLELVWSAPIRSVAADLGLSDVGLKKAARKAGLPTPPQGYWNRVAAGKKVERKPDLPPRGFGASDDIWIGGAHWQQHDPAPGPDDPIPPTPSFDEPIEDVRKRAEKAVGIVSASRDLSSPQPAIRQIVEDEAARAEKTRTSRWPSSWDAPRFNAPLDQRRLRLLNAICLGLAKVEIRGRLWRKEDPVISMDSGATSLPLIVRKLVRTGKNAETDARLSVVVGAVPGYHESIEAQWDDANGRKLEAMLTEITVDLVVLMEQRYRDSCFRHHQWLIERRAEAIKASEMARLEAERRERERIEKIEQAQVDRLLADADLLRQAQAIRAYVAEVALLYAVSNSAEVETWCVWALAQADRIDPIKSGRFLQSADYEVSEKRRHARKGRGDGEPRLDAHDLAL